MKIYLVRHGETNWNLEQKMQGSYDSDLTENGVNDAKLLGESLKNIHFDAIYSSPLGRAADTAKYVAGDRDVEIIYKDELKEMNFGIFEGELYEDIKEKYSTEWDNFWNKPHLYKSIEGEEYTEVIDRAKRILNEIIENHEEGNILVVTHTALIKAIYSIIKNLTLEEYWKEPYIHNTCLSVIEIIEGKARFVLECDTSHLEK